MQVYVASITHETNRFSPCSTTRSDYHPFPVGYGDLVDAAEASGCTVVRGLCARAAPSGVTAQADYEQLRDSLVAEICAAGDIDLVLLSLHGAQVAERCNDCEGNIIRAIRHQVGEDLPVGVLLDLHANLSTRMLEHATLVVAIKEYPHTDFPETAGQLVDLMLRHVHSRIEPVTAFVPLPLFTLWHTPQEPSRTLVERARALEQSGEALHISLLHGFPWSDVEDAGAAVLVTTDNDIEKACGLASHFARQLWHIRDADLGHYKSIHHCLDAVEQQSVSHRPELIADAADNPGAGCGGDATWILREILDRKMDGVAMALFHDPALLARVIDAGEGAELEVSVGGHSGALAGAPVQGRAQVLQINPDAHIDAMPGYPPIPLGTLAAIRIEGVQLVVGSYREQVFGPRVFTEVGIDPGKQRLLVVKSAQHFYAGFRDIAAHVYYSDSPCSRTVDFSSLPFSYRRAPLWPLDQCSEADIPSPICFRSQICKTS